MYAVNGYSMLHPFPSEVASLFFDMCARDMGSVCRLYNSAVDISVQCGRQSCSGVYANNMKCTYTCAPDHTVNGSKF